MFNIKKLTAANVEALEVTRPDHQLEVTLGKTVATFAGTPADVLKGLDAAIAAHPANGHPRSSLWAVRRKVEAVTVEETTPKRGPSAAEIDKGLDMLTDELVARGATVVARKPKAPKLTVVADVPAEAVTPAPAKDDRKLAAAKAKLAAASTALDEALAAAAKARAARAKAMVAMKDAGASYAQVAEVVGMTPMSARAAVLGAQA